jgi:hypothetical protein
MTTLLSFLRHQVGPLSERPCSQVIAGGGDFCCASVFHTEDRIKVNHIITNFEWTKPDRFAASLSRFEVDGVVYNSDGFEFPCPNAVLLLAAVIIGLAPLLDPTSRFSRGDPKPRASVLPCVPP